MTALGIDRWQFDKPAMPVSADSRISWVDFAFMHTFQQQPSMLRKPVLDWATNDAKLREVIVAFLETRARCGPGNGTLSERLVRAEEALTRRLPEMNAALDRMCREYMAADPARKKELQIQIEGHDTAIRLAVKGAATLVAVSYLYHRLRWDSVRVAEELQLKPPHVRQILYRMNEIAARLRKGTLYISKPRGPKPRHTVRLDRVVASHMRSHGWQWKQISDFLGIRSAA